MYGHDRFSIAGNRYHGRPDHFPIAGNPRRTALSRVRTLQPQFPGREARQTIAGNPRVVCAIDLRLPRYLLHGHAHRTAIAGNRLSFVLAVRRARCDRRSRVTAVALASRCCKAKRAFTPNDVRASDALGDAVV
jgi:hypothetical protein